MFYAPVQTERYFEKAQKYSEINWDNFAEVVDAFELRIKGWYIDPAEHLLQHSGHYSFTVMATTCLLIDALSQYRYGKLFSKGEHFKDFVKDFLPSYNGDLPSHVLHYDHNHNPRGKRIKKFSEVLWNGFRCGILHEAHAPLYCGVNPGNMPPQFKPTGHARYGSTATPSLVGGECPVVIVYPEHLFREVLAFFGEYIRDLKDKDPQYDGLRSNFKSKFSESFGVDLSKSALP
jgi:hypothetical protein